MNIFCCNAYLQYTSLWYHLNITLSFSLLGVCGDRHTKDPVLHSIVISKNVPKLVKFHSLYIFESMNNSLANQLILFVNTYLYIIKYILF